MTHLDHFITAQKLVWIKRLFTCGEAPWAKLLSSIVYKDKLFTMGPLWSKNLSEIGSNPFWKEALLAWSLFHSNQSFEESNILAIPLWYNPLISKEHLFYPKWNQAGIHTPLDIINPEGNLMTLEEITYLKLKANFLEYLRIERCLKMFLGKLNIHNFDLSRPIIPPYLMALLKGNGSKYFYDNLNVSMITQH